jgi:L-lactate dehydrogenase complex protein LldE
MAFDRQCARQYPRKPSNAYLFATCLVDQFAPTAGVDTVRLLEREGIAIHIPKQQICCGQPAYTSGFANQARAVARRQFALFPESWPVVVPSGSCAAMMREHFPKLFAGDPILAQQSRALADRVFELTEFLVHVVGFDRTDNGEPCIVALHTSCQARREMGSHETSASLLHGLSQVLVAGQVREEECCGFGGTFALSHPDISEALVTDKVESIRAAGADRVVSADCGCLLNILGRAAKQDEIAGFDVPSLSGEHIASFLWRRTSGAQP